MKKLIFFLMMFSTSIATQAQLTTYGGLTPGNDAGQNGATKSSFFGTGAGLNSTEDKATFIGYHAGTNSTSTTGVNTFIGIAAGRDNTNGYKNTFIGGYAGANNIGGLENTFVGASAGNQNVGGQRNVFVGTAAGRNNTVGTAHRNTYLGYQAGYFNQAGTGNVFLGNEAGYNEMGSNRLYIDNSNTATPLIYGDFAGDDVTINGSLDLTDPSGATSFDIHGTDNGVWNSEIRFFTDDTLRHVIANDLGRDRLVISPGSGENAENLVHINGSMLIGNGDLDNPLTGYKLYVKGGILTDKVKVAVYNSEYWADYVFEEDYERNSTEEVEQFIKEHKHLPNVPSAKEVNENGVDMVEMDATLLRQIEELWLHVIELKKENERLHAQIGKQ